jgi:EAL domain-containing protein (putative c-di-GMP-specific phosphodiesterase class I)/ActR/RegA family two-component response regulator
MSTARVLVLDDEPEACATIALLAETAGHEARWTVDPHEFLALHDSWSPTHLVVDLLMPHMDGIDVLAALAERSCTAAIIITSGVDSRVIQAASRFAAEQGLHIVGLLPKPVSLVDLSTLVDSTGGGPSEPAVEALRLADLAGRIGPDDLVAVLADPDGLHVAYQPKVRCGSGRLAGFEVLARWEHPELGPVPPALFVPLAEQHDLIDQLTDRVLTRALAWFSASSPRGGITLSVNISARTLGDARFVPRLVAHCRAHGVRPDSLILELTESSRSDDSVMSLRLLTRLRMQGFQLSLDDFGTGYSSMTRLSRLPFSEIKIDRSFVSTAVASEESRTVVHSIIDLGRNLGLVTVAEGVEDEETLRLLDDLGADLAQGDHIARPLSPEDAAAWTPATGS